MKPEFPWVRFAKCDGDKAINSKDFEEAGFGTGNFVFTQAPEAGIQKYTHDVNALTLYRHIKSLMTEPTENHVVEFTNEDDFFDLIDLATPPRPQFVKFFEQWCTHCKAAKRPFAHAAQQFKDTVGFVEVECSKTEENKAFCARHGVRSYPMIKLFTSEEQTMYESPARSLIGFEEFLNEKLNLTSSSLPIPETDGATSSDESPQVKEDSTGASCSVDAMGVDSCTGTASA
jgi:thiol-disulfide isomerase/thioredoxin